MLRVRLFTDEEYLDQCAANKEHKYRVGDTKTYFRYRLLDTAHDEEPHIPFRDAESLQFLKETYGITFISDDDWYSVWCEESRSDITCLYDSIQSGLAAIAMSRNGIYAWYWSMGEKEWKALANMPFDILIAMRTSEMGLHGMHHITDVDYLIENYPYGDQSFEVLVVDSYIRPDDFYTAMPELERGRYCTSYGLLKGSDGKYYSDGIGIDYAFQYYWKNDIEGIIKQIDRMRRDRIALTDTTHTYDVFELGTLVKNDKNCIVELDYLRDANLYERLYKDGDISEQEYDEWMQKLQTNDYYNDYLYFRDKFKVISHLAFVPEPVQSRKLPMLMVDKNTDGTYYIHGSLTVKYPDFNEMFWDVIPGRSPEMERFVLIVDVEELFFSVYDIEKAVCGFRVLADSVDIYDAYEGTQLFGEALKEAYHSGRCTVDKEFY